MIWLFKKVVGRLSYYKQMCGIYTAKGVECNIKHGNVTVQIIANSKIELYNRARDYDSEKVTIEWIDNFIKNGDMVYDVGANIGIFSLLIAKKYSNSKVIAFEPEAGNFYKLNKNILLNQLKNIFPFPVGISDKTGISKFYVSSTDLGSSCHSLDQPYSDGSYFTPKHEQGISTYSLSDFVKLSSLPFPNHIKIDVDGFELNVVNGIANIFKNKFLQTIMIEVSHLVSKGKVEEVIKNGGFNEKTRETWNNGNGDISNILFVRNL